MNHHLRIVVLMLGIVCGSAQKNIDWKTGMSADDQKATVETNTNVVFKWSGMKHDVYLFVDKTTYDACDFAKATKLADEATSGAYSYAAETAGTFYFGCKVPGHCEGNQKLTLTVTGMFCVWANYFWRAAVI